MRKRIDFALMFLLQSVQIFMLILSGNPYSVLQVPFGKEAKVGRIVHKRLWSQDDNASTFAHNENILTIHLKHLRLRHQKRNCESECAYN